MNKMYVSLFFMNLISDFYLSKTLNHLDFIFILHFYLSRE